jgi:hypothetical protein
MSKKYRVNIWRGGKRVNFGLTVGTPTKFFIEQHQVSGMKIHLKQIGLKEGRDYAIEEYISPAKKEKKALEEAKVKAKRKEVKKAEEKEEVKKEESKKKEEVKPPAPKKPAKKKEEVKKPEPKKEEK